MAEIRLRRGRSVEWLGANPVLAPGEPAYDTTARRLKIGDGATRWNDLPFQNDGPSDLDEHVNSETPHPVYDDAPSLVLLYQNAQV